MKVVILCGGLGTRLREETEFRPKPMVPIGGQPILWHIMKLYAHYGHTEFILCLGYKGEVIKDYFRNYQWNTSDVTIKLGRNPLIQYHSTHDEEDWTVTMLETGQETQTGGRLQRALSHIDEDTFLLTYGDGLTDSDINRSIGFHQSHGSLVTVTAVPLQGRFGELELDGATVTGFREKREHDIEFVSGGFFVMNRGIIDYLTGDACVLEQEPMQRLTAEGQLMAYRHTGFWQCMDTYREFEYLNRLWTAGNPAWKVW
jgi:glucose-1-phosphate cytidylyltransferase